MDIKKGKIGVHSLVSDEWAFMINTELISDAKKTMPAPER
eukprot:CAMPEP_0117762796 /NCGR_PEP_ID=MMETSP0947-20121206/18199_1 /TAXON_ID=44440 /ORGANISM="Chattonella subsalsa, Strain CCMP2191" /LENGTH=39 /DNA_ID= /DNA_START= /DNA_END= /DNA_ORIENTATION=